jgi:hypothetical protein
MLREEIFLQRPHLIYFLHNLIQPSPHLSDVVSYFLHPVKVFGVSFFDLFYAFMDFVPFLHLCPRHLLVLCLPTSKLAQLASYLENLLLNS